MENHRNSSSFFEKVADAADVEVQEQKTNEINSFDVSGSEILSPKFIKKWSKTYDDSTLLDKSLNSFTGELSLSIPLVDVPILPSHGIIYDLTYDQQSKAFKSQFLDDFISVEYQSSVFEDDFNYFLNMRGLKSRLKRTSVENEFSLDNSSVKVTFHRQKQQWIIQNSSDRVVYGNSEGNGAVKHGLTFKNYTGSANNLKKIPLAWYIAERHSQLFEKSIFYKYQVIDEIFPSSTAQYTSEIHLKEVASINNEVSIKFGYKIASSNEKKKFVDENGNLLLNDLMVNNHNLVSVHVETKEYQQDLQLHWIDKKLKKLTQNDENLLEFSYNDENLLTEVKTVHGTTDNYAYEKQEMKFMNAVKNFPIHESPMFGSCGNYLIFATKHPDALDVEIIDSTTMMVSQKMRVPASITKESSMEVRGFGLDFLIRYQVSSHSIIRVFKFDIEKSKFDEGVMSLLFKPDAEIQFSSNYVAVREGSSVKILQEIDGEWKTEQFNFENVVKIHANNHFVAVHEAQNLHIIYKKSVTWTQKRIKSNLVGNSSTILKKFDITSELREKLANFSSQFRDGFQSHENLLVWSTIEENSGVFHKILQFIMLDTDFEIALEEKFSSYCEDIFNLREETTDKESGIKYTLGYIKTSGKYRVGIKDMCCDAEIAEAIGSKNKNRIADAKAKNIKDSYKDESELAANFRKSFLFLSDDKYQVILTPGVIYLGSNTTFKFNGAKWVKENVQEQRTLALSDKFELKFDSSNKNLIKLIDKSKNETHNLNIFESTSLVNNYPLYIAYQPTESTTNVIFFNKGKEISSQESFNDEKLMAASSYRQLMTVKNSTLNSSDPFEVVMRSTASYMPKVAFPVVTEERRTSKDEVRLKKFERDFTTTSQKLITTPSESKSIHGWIEQLLTKETQEMKYFDADGKVVKEEVKKNQNEPEEDFRKKYADNLLYDLTGTLQISNFVPYKMSHDEIAFYGFEKYEYSENWKFDTNNLIKHETSLTGRTFLRLNTSNSTVTRSFTPKNQKEFFEASAWIRTGNSDKNSFFKAVMSVDNEELFGLYGQVMNTVGEWSRVAVKIDLVETVKKIYDEKRALNTTEVGEYQQPIFTIKLVAMGSENSPVDVDSIAFHPISHRLEANVFNEAGKVVSVLSEDNSISKFFYNPLNGKNFARTKDGKIEQFTVAGENSMMKITPQNGFQENFEVLSRWTVSNHDDFALFNGKLHHNGNLSSIKAKNEFMDEESAAVRFEYAIESNSSIDFNFNDFKISLNDKNLLLNQEFKAEIPSHGEILILKHEKRLAVWIDGKSMLEQQTETKNSWKSFEISCTGKTLIDDLFILNRPLIELHFFNNWNNEQQTIKLETDESAIISEKIYDELGRELLTTKPTKIVSTEKLLDFQSDFIRKFDPQTGKIEGLVSDLNQSDEGFPYSRTVYHKNPLGEKKIQGLPGKDFSANGKFSVEYEKSTKIPFINAFFPESQGFKHRTEKLSNGSTRVLISDKSEQKVAKYVEVPGFEHLLSTYEYDDEKRIVKVLPPSYHEAVKTFEVIDSVYRSGIDHLKEEEIALQSKLGTHFKYDRRGNLIKKQTPDEGILKLFYNSNDQLKFTKSSDGKTIFYNYNQAGLITETGFLDESFSNEILQNLVDVDSFVSANRFQQILINDEEDTKLIITTNHNKPILEELKFDKNEKISTQKMTIVSQTNSTETTYEVKRKFIGDKVKVLTYPAGNDSELKVLHTYNNLGQLVSLGTMKNPSAFATFTYNANNQIETENHTGNGINRSFDYNSPGFLQSISDQHLTEKISYIEGGYGQEGYGDGIVMKTSFDAAWSENIEHEFDNSDLDESCIDFLREADYLDDNNRFKKLFKSHVEIKTPIKCKKMKNFDELSAKFQVPSHYGHRYAYGTHRELVKSKYFSDEVEAQFDPLQSETFSSKIDGVSLEMSHEIWKIMKENKFIAVDQRHDDWKTGFGSRGINSMVRDEEIKKELKELSDTMTDFETFFGPIKRLIFHAIESNDGIELEEFKEIFLSWNDATSGISRPQQAAFIKSAEKLYKKLIEKKLLPATKEDLKDSLSNDFRSSLIKHENHLLNIVKVTSIALNHDLLTTSFDTSSHEIDANGNHKKFFTGFNQVDINYKEDTNKIDSIKINRFGDLKGQKEFKIDHDTHGNVLNAPHHGVEKFSYHPVSQRVTDVQLTDGRVIKFHYNGQGERVLKQVLSENGSVDQETFYIRDDRGNVLMDKVTTFKDDTAVEMTTHYIYGPRGLIGFIRNDIFHSVFTDHAGSVRLVIKNGEVVAAYDYLPYGELMRKFVTDETAEIAYKFNGKELDEETQTYNFHARFYDPLLGRFLQIDPQSQYFSPYKFSGNSPISFVDPDGEFVFILACITLAIVGAYLGGAAANNRFNPLEWDYEHYSTYLGIGLGGLAGGLALLGAASTVGILSGFATSLGAGGAAFGLGIAGTVTLALGGAYISASATSHSWDPSKWKWNRPDLYNALFGGAGIGSGIVGSVASIHEIAATLNSLGILANAPKFGLILKTGFLTVSYGTAGGFIYKNLAMTNDEWRFWKWDPEILLKPETYHAIMDGYNFGIALPANLAIYGGKFLYLLMNPKIVIKFVGNLSRTKIESLRKLFANPKNPFSKSAGVVLLSCQARSIADFDFDTSNWSNSIGSFAGHNEAAQSVPILRLSSSVKQQGNVIDEVRIISKFSRNEFQKVENDFSNLKISYLNELDIKYHLNIGGKIEGEIDRLNKQVDKDREKLVDRNLDFLEKCSNPETSLCFLLSDQPIIHEHLLRDEFLFDNDKFLKTHPLMIENLPSSDSIDAVLVKDLESNGLKLIADPAKKKTLEFNLLKLHLRLFIPYDGSEKIPIVTDGSEDVSIYFKQIIQQGVLGVEFFLDKDDKTERKIHLNNSKFNRKDFLENLTQLSLNNRHVYFDSDGNPIKELSHLADANQLELYDLKDERLKIVRGAVRIPSEGIKYRGEDGKLQELKTINGKNVSEIQAKNLEIQNSKKDFASKYDFVVKWEDLNSLDDNYKIINQFNSTLRPITIQFSSEINRWRVISHSLHEKSPRIFDTPFGKTSSSRRMRRNVENPLLMTLDRDFINETLNITSEWSKSPSILELGDTWLNSTDISSNLMLAYAFIKRWSNDKLNFNSTNSNFAMTSTECELFTSNAVHEFSENLIKISLNCGIPTVMREVLNDLEMHKIFQKVKGKCAKNSIDSIGRTLIKEIVEKNKWKIISRSSEKQFEKVRSKIAEYSLEFNQNLKKNDDARWKRTSEMLN